MVFTNIILIVFLTSLLTTGMLLLLVPNPIHSLLFLVLLFVNTAGILMLFDFDFIALLLIIIYVGALAVLFLFILMMIDIKIISTFQTDWFVFLIFSLLLSFLIFFQTYKSTYLFLVNTVYSIKLPVNSWVNSITEINNCETFGHVLYNYYTFLFLFAGLILLTALLGAVHLTHTLNKKKTISDFSQLSKKFFINIVK